MRQAVCALIIRNGKILSVSRRYDPNNIGLPGGKVDGDESLEHAIKREVMEETGYNIEVLSIVAEDIDGEFFVTTFHCRIIDGGPCNTKETGVVKFVDYNDLINPEKSSFHAYNLLLKEKMPVEFYL